HGPSSITARGASPPRGASLSLPGHVPNPAWSTEMARTSRGLRDERGFTLVELLIVVTILGILAAVVTTSLIGLTATARTNACAEALRTVQTAVDSLMAKNNSATVTARAAP